MARPARRNYFYINSETFLGSMEMHFLPPRAFRAYLESICWISRNRKFNEGMFVIPKRLAHTWAPDTRTRRRLLGSFWEAIDGGYRVLGHGRYFRLVLSETSEARQEWMRRRIRLSTIVFQRDGRLCAFCGSVARLTIDHIIPLARGGDNELENLQVLCQSCNSRKGTRLADA